LQHCCNAGFTSRTAKTLDRAHVDAPGSRSDNEREPTRGSPITGERTGRSDAPALIRKHGGKVLAKSPAQTLEGDDRLPGTVVMIEFPTADAARSWYDDPAHDRLKQLRRAGSDFDLLLVAGLSVRT
jgi:uncharacterized protein (DUF1330 family)